MQLDLAIYSSLLYEPAGAPEKQMFKPSCCEN